MRLILALPDGWSGAAGRFTRGALWCAVGDPVPVGILDLGRWARERAGDDVPAGASAEILAEERWQTDSGWPFVLHYRECATPGRGCVEAVYLAAYEMFDLFCTATVGAPDRRALEEAGVSPLALLQSARPELPRCANVNDWLLL